MNKTKAFFKYRGLLLKLTETGEPFTDIIEQLLREVIGWLLLSLENALLGFFVHRSALGHALRVPAQRLFTLIRAILAQDARLLLVEQKLLARVKLVRLLLCRLEVGETIVLLLFHRRDETTKLRVGGVSGLLS